MTTVVCVKHVPDTACTIKIEGENSFDQSVKYILNPYDEFAVEEALQKKQGDVIAITVGPKAAEASLRTALAMGAEQAIHIVTDAPYLDPRVVGKALGKVIAELTDVQLVFMGKQSVDAEGMQTPFFLAKQCGFSVATSIVHFEVSGDKAQVEKETEGGGKERATLQLPCVVAVDKGINSPRYPKLPDIMKAKKKEIVQKEFASLGLQATDGVTLQTLAYPEEKAGATILKGSCAETTKQLVQLLKNEAKVL